MIYGQNTVVRVCQSLAHTSIYMPDTHLLQPILRLELIPSLIQRAEHTPANHLLLRRRILRNLFLVSEMLSLFTLQNIPCQDAPEQ